MAAPTDRVQALKQETTANGGQDSQSVVWPEPINPQQDALEAMGLFIQDGSNRDESVYIARTGNDMVFRDVSNPVEKTLTDLLAGGGGGISESQHENLDTLVHRIAETNYLEVTRSSGQVSSVIVWETAAKLKKIRETTVTRSSGQVATFVEKQYDAAGALLTGQTITNTVTRSSGQVASISAVQT